MNRILAISGALLFLAVPLLNHTANKQLGNQTDAYLPYTFAGAGLLYSVLHMMFARKRMCLKHG